jgi:hypothetical protein
VKNKKIFILQLGIYFLSFQRSHLLSYCTHHDLYRVAQYSPLIGSYRYTNSRKSYAPIALTLLRALRGRDARNKDAHSRAAPGTSRDAQLP